MTKAANERAPKTQLAIIFLTRTAINTSFRIIYPFLPSIARGLGISLKTAGALVTLRMVARLASPFLGPLADRYGRRRVMEIALLFFSLASLLLAGLGTFTAAAIAFILYGVAKAIHDPAVYAYLGDTVPYHKRGRTIGAVDRTVWVARPVGCLDRIGIARYVAHARRLAACPSPGRRR
jgi:predicted MFS family arabinose efflux permease